MKFKEPLKSRSLRIADSKWKKIVAAARKARMSQSDWIRLKLEQAAEGK